MKENINEESFPPKQTKSKMRLNIKHQNLAQMVPSRENIIKPSPETEATAKNERRRRTS